MSKCGSSVLCLDMHIKVNIYLPVHIYIVYTTGLSKLIRHILLAMLSLTRPHSKSSCCPQGVYANDKFFNMPCYSILQFFIIVLKFLRSPCSVTLQGVGDSSNNKLVTYTPTHTDRYDLYN